MHIFFAVRPLDLGTDSVALLTGEKGGRFAA